MSSAASIGSGFDVVNGADVRVIRCRRRLRLAHEALLRRVVVTPLRRQEFQCDDASESAGARGVDDAHATATDAGEDLILADGAANEGIVHRVRHH